ncbi:uncharacterized protein C8A04DRAFT_38169 [Dichotomopilus funicola]|uniref:Uncharacterized protein n=1 Tax=Dichotomopilus funicola TaxID=1934379 RepID=A0AAN6ZLA6_9PEZI|nr:hypothetical protein C8A04DRAFT_38169 [Dichotomopilus funicola]
MPICNPFARRVGPALAAGQDETSGPGLSPALTPTTPDAAHPGFERVDTVGSRASSSAFSIRSGSRRSQDTGEYKMSVVNDSGVYLPPSPIEREASWPRRYLSSTSTERSASLTPGRTTGDIEHFPISRESFDSYRRSFDISAKSPVVITASTYDSRTNPTRQSLDSSLRSFNNSTRYYPRSSLSDQQRRWGPPTPEESMSDDGRFEDVGLNEQDEEGGGEEGGRGKHGALKKRGLGFFSKFGSDNNDAHGSGSGSGNAAAASGPVEESGTAMSRFLPGLGGRKKGPSAQGAELGALPDRSERIPEIQAQGVEV